MFIAYLSLGSNVGDRIENLKKSLDAIGSIESNQIKRRSSVYETEPWGMLKQNKFLNQVVELKTTLRPAHLLRICQQIENALGRKKKQKWGPRKIDIDILLYGNKCINHKDLQIPHPHLPLRRFVLVPLSEIVPTIVVPGLGKTVEKLLSSCHDSGDVKIFSDGC